jgi:phosphatidylglycerol:prolipoprotein diacylglycerol transferase
LASREAKKYSLNPDMIYDFAFWVILAGILGSRIFFILLNLDFFIANPREMVMIQHGGLAWQGGLFLGSVVALVYIKVKKLALGLMVDLVAPYLALGQAIGRVGCFLNGCCYGREVSWGVYFPAHDSPLHPTQLYDFVGLLLIFFVLKQTKRNSRFSGEIFSLYLLLASIERFINEYFRADHTELYAGLSIFQVVSAGIFIMGAGLYLILRARGAAPERKGK